MYRIEDIEYSTYRAIRSKKFVRIIRNNNGISFSPTSIPLTLDQVNDYYNYSSGRSTVYSSDDPKTHDYIFRWLGMIYKELYDINKRSTNTDETEGKDRVRTCEICGGLLTDAGVCLRCNPETRSDYEDSLSEILNILSQS